MLFMLVLLCFFLAGFQVFEQVVQSREGRTPKLAILCEPLCGLGKRLGIQAAWTPLGIALANDEAGALKHFEVL